MGKFNSLILALALGLIWAAPASANMVLSNAIVHFEPGKSNRQDIEVENLGSETMYVQVSPQQVLHPGTDQERREPITDPRSAGLLVTPNKLVIPPGGRKLVRFVNLHPNAVSERVYRVSVTPVVNGVRADTTGVKILIGYEVLVLTQPSRPEPRLVAEREGTMLHVRNDGNTNVLLREGYQCPHDNAEQEDCAPLTGKRIYPGNQWSVSLPYDRPVEYFLAVGTRNAVEVYP